MLRKITFEKSQSLLTMACKLSKWDKFFLLRRAQRLNGDLGDWNNRLNDVTAGAWSRLLSPRTADLCDKCPNHREGERDKFEVGVGNLLLIQAKEG